MATNLEKLHRKYREDALFRRLAIGSPTWAEMISEAIMKDRTGWNYSLASHNAASIDLVAENGIGGNLAERMEREMLRLLHLGERNQANFVRLAGFFERPTHTRIARQSLAAIGRSFKCCDGDCHCISPSWRLGPTRLRDSMLPTLGRPVARPGGGSAASRPQKGFSALSVR